MYPDHREPGLSYVDLVSVEVSFNIVCGFCIYGSHLFVRDGRGLTLSFHIFTNSTLRREFSEYPTPPPSVL